MNNKIFLRQVLEIMSRKDEAGKAVPFDVEFKTYNRNNKTGGSSRQYKGAKLCMGEKLKGRAFIDAEHFYRKEKNRKNPNHWKNRTRNIELQGGQVKKLNILYITKFNGLEVIY